MKLEYKILWLDDKIQVFVADEHIEGIESHLDEKGFKHNIVKCENEKDFYTNLNDTYDLIVTDYNLLSKTGSDIIDEIRNEKSILTEVLFYTAQTIQNQPKDKNRITFLETKSKGDHHKVVIKEIIKIIDLTIKKFEHIVSMRGMIMNETSSLDSQNLKIMLEYIDKNPNNIDDISNYILSEISTFIESKSNFIRTITKKRNGKLKALTKDTFLFSSAFKIKTLSKILEKLDETDFSKDYENEIISIRNKFAHAILEKDEKGDEFFKIAGEMRKFDKDFCKEIRKNINKHKSNLDKLEEKVNNLKKKKDD